MGARARAPEGSGLISAKAPGAVAAGVALVAALAALLWGCSRGPEKRSDAEVVVAEVDGTLVVLSDVKREILSMRGYTPSLETKRPTARRSPMRCVC